RRRLQGRWRLPQRALQPQWRRLVLPQGHARHRLAGRSVTRPVATGAAAGPGRPGRRRHRRRPDGRGHPGRELVLARELQAGAELVDHRQRARRDPRRPVGRLGTRPDALVRRFVSHVCNPCVISVRFNVRAQAAHLSISHVRRAPQGARFFSRLSSARNKNIISWTRPAPAAPFSFRSTPMNKTPIRIAVLSLSLALGLAACSGGNEDTTRNTAADDKVSAQITGAGATFIFPLISKWSADYNAATGNMVNYQSIGSGGGIAQIKAGTVDFGSSDEPLSSEELDEAGLIQFPSAIGGVVPVVNVEGIGAGEIRLNGEVLADIYLTDITQWNDPAIAALNPDLPLPATKINLVHRSDGSGTTFNFTNYLSKVSPAWQERIGQGKQIQWVDGVGGKGNEGVASYVQQIDGAIGYVELAYAIQNDMSYASLQNAAGNWVTPSLESFQAAAATADRTSAQDVHLVSTNAPAPAAWPITAANFI